MFDTIRIKVNDFALKNVGIIVNKKFIFPRNSIMEVVKNKVVFYGAKKIVLKFKDKEHRDDFLNEIGIKAYIDT